MARPLAHGQTHPPGNYQAESKPPLSEAKAYYASGVSHSQKREWDKAISDLSEAARLNPQDPLAYWYRGAAYLNKGDLDKASKDFDQVIRLDPTNAVALCNRGSVRRAKGESDQAIKDFSECLRLDPKNTLAYKARAECYAGKLEYDKAINDWSQALLLVPTDGTALALRGFAHSRRGRFAQAVGDFTAAIRLDPTNGLAYNTLAWLRATCAVASMRNGKEAVEAATQACELSRWTRWEWVDTLAAAYAEAGDFSHAVQYQWQAMQMPGVTDYDRSIMKPRLALYRQKRPYHEDPNQ
jgi:tetratricopeptide (TPR) repeat protein